MWSDALDMMDQAERLHRQFFRPAQAGWEPPVDVLETANEVLILTALPGVSPESIEASIQSGVLVISGMRTLPRELSTAKIHRLELPQGRFERRVNLPGGRYDQVRRNSVNGCLVISLHKASGGV
jgi:HSP20 family molecular chaperone IbpA